MEIFELVAHKRESFGGRRSKKLRNEALVPGVVYGKGELVHFYTYMFLLEKLKMKTNACFVDLNIDGEVHRSILKDIQLHPVSDMLVHADFFKIDDKKKITMEIPVVTKGKSPGVAQGGVLSVKENVIPVSALPGQMPDSIVIDLTNLKLNDIVRIKDVAGNYPNVIIDRPVNAPVVSIDMSRALRSEANKNKG